MFVRSTHSASYPGIVTTAGNMAHHFSPFRIPIGPAYRVCRVSPDAARRSVRVFPMTIEK
jgi:hypothetical protein